MATRTWNHTNGGTITNAANWLEGVVPVNGDSVIFPDPHVVTDPSTNFAAPVSFVNITRYTSSAPNSVAGLVNLTNVTCTGTTTWVASAACPAPTSDNQSYITHLSMAAGSTLAFDLRGFANLNVSMDYITINSGATIIHNEWIESGGMTVNGTLNITKATAVGVGNNISGGSGTINLSNGVNVRMNDILGATEFTGTVHVLAGAIVDFQQAGAYVAGNVKCGNLNFAEGAGTSTGFNTTGIVTFDSDVYFRGGLTVVTAAVG